MALDRSREAIQAPRAQQGKPDIIPRTQNVEYVASQSQSTPIVSDLLAATINSIGLSSQFKELQIYLGKIRDGESYLHEFASGAFQEQIESELLNGGKSEQHPALGTITRESQRFGTVNNRDKVNAYALAKDNLSKALNVVYEMQSWMTELLKRVDTSGFKKNTRQEPLASWAFRVGAALNPDIENNVVIDLQSRATNKAIDYYGLDNIIMDIRLTLETLDNLSAYYRTGYSVGESKTGVTMKVVYPRVGETIESVAARELGSSDMATVLMDFNNLSYENMLGDDWINTRIKIPTFGPSKVDSNNFVLDSHVGGRLLGSDLPNTLVVEKGDLKVLQFTDNFAQALSNRLETSLGALPDSPRYGTDLIRMASEIVPTIRTGLIGKEAERTVLQDPRVKSVKEVTVTQDDRSLNISMQVETVDGVTEDQLIKYSETI